MLPPLGAATNCAAIMTQYFFDGAAALCGLPGHCPDEGYAVEGAAALCGLPCISAILLGNTVCPCADAFLPQQAKSPLLALRICLCPPAPPQKVKP